MRLTPRLTCGALALLLGCGKAEPPAAAAAAGPVDSALVVLDSAQRASAALVIATVGALPSDTIQLTGTLSFDPARISHVGPRIHPICFPHPTRNWPR